MIHWNDSQNSERLLYTRLWFITVEGIILKSVKAKVRQAEFRRIQAQTSSCSFMGELYRQCFIFSAAMHENINKVLLPIRGALMSRVWALVSRVGTEGQIGRHGISEWLSLMLSLHASMGQTDTAHSRLQAVKPAFTMDHIVAHITYQGLVI